jgi:hypothetical protein
MPMRDLNQTRSSSTRLTSGWYIGATAMKLPGWNSSIEQLVRGEAEVGDRFFSTLARSLAQALEVAYAFVSRLSNVTKALVKVCTRAKNSDGLRCKRFENRTVAKPSQPSLRRAVKGTLGGLAGSALLTCALAMAGERIAARHNC